jgi:glycopeptide antibiotics resistance protein
MSKEYEIWKKEWNVAIGAFLFTGIFFFFLFIFVYNVGIDAIFTLLGSGLGFILAILGMNSKRDYKGYLKREKGLIVKKKVI